MHYTTTFKYHAQAYLINKLTKNSENWCRKGSKQETWRERLFIHPAAPVIWQQRVAGGGGGGDVNCGGKKGPRTALFVGFSRRGPCGSWRLWGRAAYSPCSPRQNAAQEDRKEARLFFMDALSV